MRVCPDCKVVLFSNGYNHKCAKEVIEQYFSCPHCTKAYKRKSSLFRHIKSTKGKCVPNAKINKEKLFSCYQCSKKFLRARDIPRHVQLSCPGTKYAKESLGIVVDNSHHVPLQICKQSKQNSK